MKQIEVNGITYVVDEKMFITEEIRVGDNVQILKKDYSTWKTYPGVVTQILPFNEKPAIQIVYVDATYSGCEVKTLLITDDTNDEVKLLTKAHPLINLTKERVVDILEKKVSEAEIALEKAKYNLDYFNKYFGDYFKDQEVVEHE